MSKLTPKLRFYEFIKPWKDYSLDTLVTFKKGKGISKNDIVDNGKYKCIRYGELYTHYKEVIHYVISTTNISKNLTFMSAGNEILIPASGETAIDIARASVLPICDIAIGSDINILIPKSNHLHSAYLAYYISGIKKYDIAMLAQGNSVVHLYASQLSKLKIRIPETQEQNKIANFLSLVDKKITLQSQKVELLQQYKKGMTQKLFSQEIRFKDDNGASFSEWNECELSSIALKVNIKNKDESISNVLTNSATQGIVSQADYFDREIVTSSNLGGYYVVNIGDFVYNPRISSSAPVGPIKMNKHSLGVMSPLYTVFRFTKGNNQFYQYFFESTQWHDYMKSVANSGARHDRMNITTSHFLSLPIPQPSEEEQQKIADFLSSIDDKITIENNKLDKLKQWKQGLLQQMFV